MQHMVVDQEVKAMELAEVKVDQVDRKDAVEEIEVQEVVWEEIVPRNEGHMRMPYPTRKSPFRVTVAQHLAAQLQEQSTIENLIWLHIDRSQVFLELMLKKSLSHMTHLIEVR